MAGLQNASPMLDSSISLRAKILLPDSCNQSILYPYHRR
jgi:hypothetical protein